MSKNLNSILNNVVRTLFEEDDGFDFSSTANDIAAGAQQVPAGGPQIVQRQQYGVNWDGTPLYFDQLPAADQARILAANQIKPGEAEVYTEPASFMDKVQATTSNIYDKGKEFGQKVAEWDKNASKASENFFNNTEKGAQQLAGKAATGIGNTFNLPSFQKFGIEHNPNVNVGDKLRYISNIQTDAIRGASGRTAFDDLKDTATGLGQKVSGAVDSGVQFAKDLAAKHGSSIPGVGRQVEDWGYENNPNVNFLDKAGKFFRRTGEDISGAFGNAKDAVVGAWNDATPAQKAAALGALGTTALASGAGALYLRKKQRAANKAAGRK